MNYELRPYVKVDANGRAMVIGEFTAGQIERINAQLTLDGKGLHWKAIEEGKLESYILEIAERLK